MACLQPVVFQTRVGRILGGCGVCQHCGVRRMASWTTRQELEASAHLWRASFLTLTFGQAALPRSRSEVQKRMRKFFMDLRRAIAYRLLPGDGVRAGAVTPAGEAGFSFGSFRYFAACEHGSKGGRVHLHVNLFGLLPGSRIGDATLAELVVKAWQDSGQNGRAYVLPLRRGGAAYVAKYIGKAVASPDRELASRGLEFRMVSNGGGRRAFGGLGALALPALAAEYAGMVPADVSTVVRLDGGRRGFLTSRLADRLRRLVGFSVERIEALRRARLGELVLVSAAGIAERERANWLACVSAAEFLLQSVVSADASFP